MYYPRAKAHASAHFAATLLCGVTIVFLSLSPPARAQSTNRADVPKLRSPLQALQTRQDAAILQLAFDQDAYEKLRAEDRATLSGFPLPALGRVDLDLQRVEVFTPSAQIVAGTPEGDVPLPRPDVVIFSGAVAGDPDSQVFLSLSPHGSQGLITSRGRTFVVSTPRGAKMGGTVIYDRKALPAGAIQGKPWTCGTDQLPLPPRAAGGIAGGDLLREFGALAALSSTGAAVLAIETDWEFTGFLFGGDTGASGAYAATLIAAASEIYIRDVGAQLQIGYLRLWPDSNDPWTINGFDALYEFQNYWNLNMTHIERHTTHFLAGKSIGGGVAYLSALCDTNWNYGLSGNLRGYFPYPLQDNVNQNWDVIVVSHELGHNFGAPHTHDMAPPIDECGIGICTDAANGTIMSYCHECDGYLSNIALRFHERMLEEAILPYLYYETSCDLGLDERPCELASPATNVAFSRMNRFLAIEGGNPGVRTAIRIKFVDIPPPNEHLNGQTAWVDSPGSFSELAGTARAADAPNRPSFNAAALSCSPTYQDWSSFGPFYVYGESIVPGGTYLVQEIRLLCYWANESSYSSATAISTSIWGDAVKDCSVVPCGPANDLVEIIDAVAIINKFINGSTGPIKTRCDIEPARPDMIISVGDILAVLRGFLHQPYPHTAASPCQ